jgi:hypothetical protein
VLINLGDLDQAERELVRVEGMYADDMDATTATQAVSMHGWLQFDRGNLPAAQNWFADNLYAAQRRGWASLEGESHHFIALCELGQALMMTDNPRRLSLLRSAEMHMNQSTTCKRRTSESGSIFGFEHFRLSQVLDGQGRHADALIERRKAVALFGDDIAVNHVHIHTADFSLEDGDTAAARRSAHGAMEAWRVMKYAIGMSRAARVLGQLPGSARCVRPTTHKRHRLRPTDQCGVSELPRQASPPVAFGQPARTGRSVQWRFCCTRSHCRRPHTGD